MGLGHLPAHCQPESSQLLTGCQCDCSYFYSFNLICQHIFAVFNVLQVKRLGHCYKLFSRWLRVSENDDYYNENVQRGIENPFFVKISERERLYYMQEDFFSEAKPWSLPLDGLLIDREVKCSQQDTSRTPNLQHHSQAIASQMYQYMQQQ